MARVGNWGKSIQFSVNSQKQITFRGFKRTVAGRWAKHSILNQKPRMEFQGPESSGVVMEVVVSAMHGVKPRTIIQTLERACEMYLESISETWDEIWNQGELVRATLSLTFSEYT